MHIAVSFVASGLPHGNRGLEVQLMQPLQQILGILPGGINPNVQMQAGMFALELFEGLLEFLITVCGFGKMEGLSGRAFLFIQKRHMMAIACGVDPDSNPDWVGGSVVSHHNLRGQRKENQAAVVRLLREALTRNARDKASASQDVTNPHVKVRREQSKDSGQATATIQRSSRTTDTLSISCPGVPISIYERLFLSRWALNDRAR